MIVLELFSGDEGSDYLDCYLIWGLRDRGADGIGARILCFFGVIICSPRVCWIMGEKFLY